MTGLDLEPFLWLLRADLGVWLSLVAVLSVLGLMAWTSWGSRRALRKCLVLSILAHAGLLAYGGRLNSTAAPGEADGDRERIQAIRVVRESGGPDANDPASNDGTAGRQVADWDRPLDLPEMKDVAPKLARFAPDAPSPARLVKPRAVASPDLSQPDVSANEPPRVEPDSPPEPAVAMAPAIPDDMPDAAPPVAVSNDPDAVVLRARPDRPRAAASRTVTRAAIEPINRPSAPMPAASTPALPSDDRSIAEVDRPAPDPATSGIEVATARIPQRGSSLPVGDLRSRPGSGAAATARRAVGGLAPITIARNSGRGPALPASRPVNDVPLPYRARIDPNRLEKARAFGASDRSEQAVERALEWLARHQDADGRWNAGTKKYSDDTLVPGEANFTLHCPPGEPCSGECVYHEADTAMTGLALLAYLGAGYTHDQGDGKYSAVVGRGLNYLLASQKADGDLRGESRVVGMYCHAMASLALCEAYALSRDERLRGPAEKAVNFLLKSRATDGLSWRYQPGAAEGDTSLLGWAILVFKSAKEVGIPVPETARVGALGWLNLVAEGRDRGLAVYRPREGPYGEGHGNPPYVPGRNMTPTMTAEAWVCRQFLGVGGPGAASDEAARYLLQDRPERDDFNLYYWYYGTLAMFQRGGPDWALWNARVRDPLIALQKTSGHESGSWDPRDSHGRYDLRGGRIYCTALAAMTLEVYYRYQRTGDGRPPSDAATRVDPKLRRSGQGTTSRP